MTSELHARVWRRVWRMASFSDVSDHAKLLWFYLTTAIHQQRIPGLLQQGALSLSGWMNWTHADTQARLGELIAAGLAQHDPVTKLLWVPEAFRMNMPASRNAILGWMGAWEDYRRCDLLDHVAREILELLANVSPAHAHAWRAVLGEVDPVFGRESWDQPPYAEVHRRDRGVCRYCGSGQNIEADHVVPLKLGGDHDARNIVVACRRCNSRKGQRTPEQAGMALRAVPR